MIKVGKKKIKVRAMFQKGYQWILKWASHPRAPWILAAISFAESSFSPFPPDPLMIPMIIAKREKAWVLAFLSTMASVLGGLVGYLIGAFLFEKIGLSILKTYGLMEKFEHIKASFNEWGFWIILLKGLTPIPYKFVTITSGVTQLNILTFTVASLLSRGIRFYLEAALIWYFGEPIRLSLEKHLTKITLAGAALLIAGFVILKYLW